MPTQTKRRLIGLALCATLATGALAQSRIVSIPATAKRASFTFAGSNEIVVNGRAVARLAPGVRIFDRGNFLVMYGALAGTFAVKYLIEENSGLVLSVWLLTDEEIAAPDPQPARQ